MRLNQMQSRDIKRLLDHEMGMGKMILDEGIPELGRGGPEYGAGTSMCE